MASAPKKIVAPANNVTERLREDRIGEGLKPGDTGYGDIDTWRNELRDMGDGKHTVQYCATDRAFGYTWPDTLAGDTVQKNGEVGQNGCAPNKREQIGRTCRSSGGWEATTTSTCTLAFCASTGSYPETAIGATATVPCGTGYTGERRRPCNASGWGRIDRSACAPIACAADGVWPITAVGESVDVPCDGANQIGSMRRQCQVGGSWGSIDRGACERGTCGPDRHSGWLITAVGQRATKPCPVGMQGTQYRNCTSDGFAAVDSSNCSVLPPLEPPAPAGPPVAPPPNDRDIRPAPDAGVPVPDTAIDDPRQKSDINPDLATVVPSLSQQWEDLAPGMKYAVIGLGAVVMVTLVVAA